MQCPAGESFPAPPVLNGRPSSCCWDRMPYAFTFSVAPDVALKNKNEKKNNLPRKCGYESGRRPCALGGVGSRSLGPSARHRGHRMPAFLGLPTGYITARQPGAGAGAGAGPAVGPTGMPRKDLEETGSPPGPECSEPRGSNKRCIQRERPARTRPVCLAALSGAYQGEASRLGAPGTP